MKTLIIRLGLLVLAAGGTFLTVPLLQTPEREWLFTYNARGLLESADGPRTDVQDITRYEYDSHSNLTRMINAVGHMFEMSNFDYLGNPQTIVDPNGVLTLLTYTPQGRLSSVSIEKSTLQIDYNATGDITRLTQGDGGWIAYIWDDARRLIRIENDLMEQVEFELDPMGNQTAIRLKDETRNITNQHRKVYDELGRLLYSVGANEQTSHLKYDLNDNTSALVTPRGTEYGHAFDSLNRLIKSTDPLSGTTHFEYDAQDNLSHIRDARGVSTRYHFDGLGNLTQLDSPDSGTSKYKYDAAGNITEKTDARGIVTSYAYDALNRLLSRGYPANPKLDVRFHYDSIAEGNKGVGRLTAIEDMNGVQTYFYDAHGNLIKQLHTPSMPNTAQSESVGYGYDTANRLNRIAYPAGFNISYLRNTAGQVTRVQIQHGNEAPFDLARDLDYLPFGPLKSLTWGNGITLQRTYDRDYLLSAQVVTDWSNTYSYDRNGNITKIQSNEMEERNYSYDSMDRLVEKDDTNSLQSYFYDAVGNRVRSTHTLKVSEEGNSTQIDYQYGQINNRLEKINDQLISIDPTDNIISDRVLRQFTYDANNRMTSAKIAEMPLIHFRYNAIGQRISKEASAQSTTFLYGHDRQLIGETHLNKQGKKVSSQYYFWLDDIPLGGITIDYDASESEIKRSIFFIHSDHLNTPRRITNDAMKTVWTWRPDSFGNGESNGTFVFNLRFPGQYYDTETGLHYNYFRDYDPESGRYLESDPIGLEGGVNTYAYVNGNPLKLVDPLGLESVFEWSSKAETIAEKSGLPGPYNGPQDAYRHCVASCMIASSNWGESVSRFAGWAHEVSNFGQNKYERAMDDWNNQAGLCAAKDSEAPSDCPDNCMNLIKKKVLIMEATSHGAYY
ncbi:RHS repeat-associated core domain-containing protein [Pseudomonas sp. RA_105y_Pfl2_P56]|uniref:RHS repeat-associated core domain-containing protein n=1 Tax=Pseudomonas sp. RA_105y_Pfl2_P56 TaxID=3088701 RepID=UPI0030DC7882